MKNQKREPGKGRSETWEQTDSAPQHTTIHHNTMLENGPVNGGALFAPHHTTAHHSATQHKDLPGYLQADRRRNGVSFSLQIRINVHLLATIKNAISSAMLGGNYQYRSTADFVREALREYAVSGELKMNIGSGPRKLFSLRLDEELKNFWESMPSGQRSNILERAIRTKLAPGS